MVELNFNNQRVLTELITILKFITISTIIVHYEFIYLFFPLRNSVWSLLNFFLDSVVLFNTTDSLCYIY